MALAHVVQQVLDALGQALALRGNRFLLGLGVQGQEVAGRHGCHPLFYGKADAFARLGVGLHGLGHTGQGLGVEQVGIRRPRGQGVLGPGGRAEALVFEGRRLGHALAPESGGFAHVVLLQFLQLGRIQLHCGWTRSASRRCRKGRHCLGPLVGKELLELLRALIPRSFRSHVVSCVCRPARCVLCRWIDCCAAACVWQSSAAPAPSKNRAH